MAHFQAPIQSLFSFSSPSVGTYETTREIKFDSEQF